MCGICGIASARPEDINRESLGRMSAALIHRGPDSDGVLLRPGIGLATRRLAVIDLITGDQPIANEDGTLWVALNGEIYNFPSLRRQLEARGHRFSTRSDTECILHLFEEYGESCVRHLRGMFAYALWDDRRRQLFLARDRLGKKPLYYTVQGSRLYFSSELPSLLQGLDERPPVLLEALDAYLAMQYVPDPWTPFDGVWRLPAAHWLHWNGGDLRLERYWDVTYLPKWEASDEELIEELRARLQEAVRCRLVADVPLGAHLSGGIDSSIVVSLMAEAGAGVVKTFSIGFEESSFSELRYARMVADRYGTDHHEFVLRAAEVQETLPTVVKHLGEPLADPSALALYHLSRLTRQHVTVALNGDGGDETFAGYQRYWLDPWADRYLRLPRILTRSLFPWIVSRVPVRGNRPVGADWIVGLRRVAQLPGIDRRASILRWGSYFTPEQRCRLWQEQLQSKLSLDRPERLLVELYEQAPAASRLDRTLYADVHSYLPGDLLIKADRMTMAASLEGRSPFLDHELVEWAARLPERCRLAPFGGKVLLRKAFRHHLPAAVYRRGKQGFGLPVSGWFRSSLNDWAAAVLLGSGSALRRWFRLPTLTCLLDEHREGIEDHGKRLWALLVLGLWSDSLGLTSESLR